MSFFIVVVFVVDGVDALVVVDVIVVVVVVVETETYL